MRLPAAFAALAVPAALACSAEPPSPPAAEPPALATYAPVRLTADLTGLSANERQMLVRLIEAAEEMDKVFWLEAVGGKDSVLGSISDPELRRYAEINYGPWDRLDGDKPFVPGVGPKPLGARFYPPDLTKEALDSAAALPGGEKLLGQYSIVRRDGAGRLMAVPYRVAFAPQVRTAAARLRMAAELAEDPGLRKYLELRATALETDDYQASDFAWMAMKDNGIDVVIGPIENYEDKLAGVKTSHEAFVLLKDREWSRRLARYAGLLPALQRGLPVPDRYKAERPGANADLNAYDLVYVVGEANAGSKTIAINLPNDEKVQLEAGTRRLQLKNAMQAKFDRILVPIADALVAPEQRAHVTFDAFFENVMFHEVAHGLGIKNTINGRGTVRQALRERYAGLEEGKADVLGLVMIAQLGRMGELDSAKLRDNQVTYMAGIFRSVRFGASSAHGRANIAQFNFLRNAGAFARRDDGTWAVDFARFGPALDSLAAVMLAFQGDGDYDGLGAWMEQHGAIPADLQGDLDRLRTLGIPSDIVFEQGLAVLGLP